MYDPFPHSWQGRCHHYTTHQIHDITTLRKTWRAEPQLKDALLTCARVYREQGKIPANPVLTAYAPEVVYTAIYGIIKRGLA